MIRYDADAAGELWNFSVERSVAGQVEPRGYIHVHLGRQHHLHLHLHLPIFPICMQTLVTFL